MRRWEWLEGLVNTHGWMFGAELGVKRGRTLFYLLDRCPGLQMIGVDCWIPQPDLGEWGYTDYDHEENERQVRIKARDFPGRIYLYKMTTVEAAQFVSDESLDFVFIDAAHDTKSVKADILAWKGKVKPDGMLCGHDAGKPTVRWALEETLQGWRRVPYDNCWEWKR